MGLATTHVYRAADAWCVWCDRCTWVGVYDREAVARGFARSHTCMPVWRF